MQERHMAQYSAAIFQDKDSKPISVVVFCFHRYDSVHAVAQKIKYIYYPKEQLLSPQISMKL